MRGYILVLLLVVAAAVVRAQDSYGTMTRTALETMWEYGGTDSTGFDTTGYRLALTRFQAAFARFPDSIDYLGLYKGSVLAGELGDLDTAFTYLESLLALTEADGTGWEIIVGKYVDSEYPNLLGDDRWRNLVQEATKRKTNFYPKLRAAETELLANKSFYLDTTLSGEELYKKICAFNPHLPKKKQNYSVSLPINDSISTSYLVHLPPDYEPTKNYPLLIFLHGAVRANALVEYQTADDNLGGWNRFYTKYADSTEVILVFPKGSEEYNWMVPDAGFFMVPTIVKQLKKSLNIDNDKVFITGHSNGATGSFSYLVKQPTLFAGFYGFNTYPKVRTGGTFPENARNRSFLNFSTDQDYYYPPTANDSLSALMSRLDVDYRDVRFNGFPHWFPQFDESEEAYRLLFADLAKRERNPFSNQLTWEFDDNAYGTIDWLSDMKLDTLARAADWQQSVNFRITEWLENNDEDSLITIAVDRGAFDLPRKSGKVRATYAANTYRLETSRIGGVTIRISPEMVDLNDPVEVYVNGALKFSGKVSYDKSEMVKTFTTDHDRAQVWIDAIKIEW